MIPNRRSAVRARTRGIRTLTIVRGAFLLFSAATVWIIGVNLFEKVLTSVVAGLVLVAIGGSLYLLERRTAVEKVGLAGCFIDIAVLSTLPVLWYQSVGGSEVPPAYMLKTQLTLVTLALVALNALAIRPLYPIVVAGGGISVQIVLLAYILPDTRTILSSDFVDSAMGNALSLELVLTGMLIIAVTGAVMGALTRIARRTVIQGVQLEVANTRLGRYFSPGVVSRISDDGLPGVGGRTQQVAVLFCDIRATFTTISENLPPPDVVEFLSQYHARMVEVIFRFGGTIDKFIGDAIMVTFGTPDPHEDDDPERAVRAGLAMNAALVDLNADRAKQSLPEIRHGIGIHYGSVIAGNIGTETGSNTR